MKPPAPLPRWRRALMHGVPLAMAAAWLWLAASVDRWPTADGNHVLGGAIRLAQQLRGLQLAEFLRSVDTLIAPHPPGAYLSSTASYLLLGSTVERAYLLGMAFVLYLCLDGVRRLGGPAGWPWALASGLIWVQAENVGVDLMAAAAVVQALSHLRASDRLRRRGHVLAWGAWMGLAFLTKYTAPFFLWGPCLIAGFWVVRDRRWRALATALAAFTVVSAPWWLTHGGQVWGYVQASSDASNAMLTTGNIVQDPSSWANLAWYPAAIGDALGWVGAVVLGLCLLLPWRWRGAPAGSWSIPLLSVLGGLALLAAQTQRQDRYALPVLPVMAAAAGSSPVGLVFLPLGIYGLYSAGAFHLSVDAPPTRRRYGHDLVDVGSDWPWTHSAYRPVSWDPARWQLDESLERLRTHVGQDDGTVGFLLDEEQGAPSYGLVAARSMVQGYRWHIATVFFPRDPRTDAQVFVGPFAADDWPSRDFDTLLAIHVPVDDRHERWLEQAGLTLVDRWEIRPAPLQASVYQRPTAP